MRREAGSGGDLGEAEAPVSLGVNEIAGAVQAPGDLGTRRRPMAPVGMLGRPARRRPHQGERQINERVVPSQIAGFGLVSQAAQPEQRRNKVQRQRPHVRCEDERTGAGIRFVDQGLLACRKRSCGGLGEAAGEEGAEGLDGFIAVEGQRVGLALIEHEAKAGINHVALLVRAPQTLALQNDLERQRAFEIRRLLGGTAAIGGIQATHHRVETAQRGVGRVEPC
jgi:hypothetical protein